MGTAGRTAPAIKEISVELKTCDLNYTLVKVPSSKPLTQSTKPFHIPPMLTSIAQNGRPGLTIGHQALGSLVWVGESRRQAWGEYNMDRNMNYCGGGGGECGMGKDNWLLGIWPESGIESFQRTTAYYENQRVLE